MTSSQYIISLPGVVSPSSSKSNVVNITNSSGNGNPSNVSIDLSKLDGVAGVGCEFDVYSMNWIYNGAIIAKPNGTSVICESGANDGSGQSWSSNFRDEFLSYMNNASLGFAGPNYNNHLNTLNTNSIFVPPTGNGIGINAAHCHFIVSGYDCNNVALQSTTVHFLDANNNTITATSGSTTIYKTDSTTITCSTNPSINLNYPSFNAELTNSCSNPDQSFLVLTPKSGVTGLQTIGSSINSDGSENIGFNINNINNQNGQFYLNINCAKDSNNKDIMEIVLNDVMIV